MLNLTDPLIEKAYQFAQTAHFGQKRLSGEPFVNHALSVAQILAGWKMDTASLVAGLLHDTIEDGAATRKDIVQEFGPEVATLVDGVTKVGGIKLRGSLNEEFVENLRKMFLAMAADLRVVMIKLADRLHNMRTLEFLPAEKQQRIARETLEVYAPLADRLGMGEVKGELDDLAFKYLYSQDYDWLVKFAAPGYKKAEEHVTQAKRKLLTALAGEKISAQIHGRKKHWYSLYKKLLRPEINKDLSLIYDLTALRILVETVEQCYIALGVTHKIFKPVASLGVSDYIALPKPNGYRSIHTRVLGPDGHVMEIQIRTRQMHDEAEYGVAAHWYYVQEKTKGASNEKLDAGKIFTPPDKLSWIKQLANWQKEVAYGDALSQRIFVLTPKGDVKDLPLGATPIDFAYAVHSQLGDRAVGAKVNGKMVAFDYQLKSGDVCEVLLAKGPQKPHPDWLKFVVTNLAKKEIQKGLRAPLAPAPVKR